MDERHFLIKLTCKKVADDNRLLFRPCYDGTVLKQNDDTEFFESGKQKISDRA